MRIRPILNDFRRDESGVAALEMGMVGTLLAIALLNVVEVSRYAYMSTQVAAASQAGAQAALVACDESKTPVTLNCPGLQAAVTTAIGGTSLKASVSVAGGLTEGWYCLTASNALQYMSAASSKPASCAVATPALYLQVKTSYAYDPIFPGLTIAQSFPAAIERTSWMRTL